MFFAISEDAFLESFEAGKDATSELILGQVAEESFDQVEPTAAGGREVKMNAPVARRPALNHRVFVGGIAVDDKVELFVGGRLAVDETQELQPFLKAVRSMQVAITLQSSVLRAANNVVVPCRLQSCVIVWARPFFVGKPGWVRSRAWIWLFSSNDSTSACSGGFRYTSTTSSSFSAKRGSLLSLKVSTRCGFRP
jgi:hypothetical protein